MVNYKLIYFNIRARAEVSRMLFAQAGVEYEDKRVPREDWPNLKNTTPMGQIPLLEVDGEVFCQSRSIERFLAKRFGLAGKTDVEQFKVDMIMECVEDCFKGFPPIVREQDAGKKEELRKQQQEIMPHVMSGLEHLLKSNKGGDGFFVGDELTVADLSVICFETFPKGIGIDLKIEDFPKLLAHKRRIESLPKIAAWIAKRPDTVI